VDCCARTGPGGRRTGDRGGVCAATGCQGGAASGTTSGNLRPSERRLHAAPAPMRGTMLAALGGGQSASIQMRAGAAGCRSIGRPTGGPRRACVPDTPAGRPQPAAYAWQYSASVQASRALRGVL
jgi:hypothetical protein